MRTCAHEHIRTFNENTPVFYFDPLPVVLYVAAGTIKIMGPTNVGREYGSPNLPLFISHVPKKNQPMLSRGRAPHHTMFTRLLCFKRFCRVKAGRAKALHSISFEKFKKKIKKGEAGDNVKIIQKDSIRKKSKPVVPVVLPSVTDTVQAPLLMTDSLIVLGEVLFATNSSTLKSEQFAVLDSIADFLIKNPALIVKISGHTDNTGSEPHNLKLSTQRADVVAEFLVDNGVKIDRVSSIGFGSSRPIAPNTTELGKKKNRRVELLIHNTR
ncbi:MAG: OmpA family protein [Bacteroidota bacterium]